VEFKNKKEIVTTPVEPKAEENKNISNAVRLSKALTNSIKTSALSITDIYINDKLDVRTIISEIEDQFKTILNGETQEIEKMLFTQSKTLSTIFSNMITRMISTDSLKQLQVFADLGLKAQNQCRQTLAVLSELKHPKRRTTFIKQQNNAINQQINNQNSELDSKKSVFANELLEATNETMDIRTSVTSVPSDSKVETLGEIHGSKNNRRENHQ